MQHRRRFVRDRYRPVIESEAERRGRLAAEPDAPEDFVFRSTDDYIQAMAAQVRVSGLKTSAIARAASEEIKSPQTIVVIVDSVDGIGGKHFLYGLASEQEEPQPNGPAEPADGARAAEWRDQPAVAE